ncbi:tetratricopeptide repeat protein [Rhodocyclus tenuis]|uniref:tetratricopeptide repeat protein n=1 Tax=Rhodocyclus tenuis TaxID=1066 RepID=UPI001905BAA6|nr:tetratricopeptide repeat protein [Rhodocyclus tenuis]
MNDIQLANAISTAVGKHFTLAKEVAEDYPGYCLVTLRAMCKLVCKEIIEVKKLAVSPGGDLGTLFSEMFCRVHPEGETKRAFHDLRGYGNKGAHPDECRLDRAELQGCARVALGQAIKVLRFAHSRIYPKIAIPAEIESAPVERSQKSLCYRAIIEEDAEAQYWIGKHFIGKAEEVQRDEAGKFSGFGPLILGENIHGQLKKANFWFGLSAQQSHPAALYEKGRLLIDGVEGEKYLQLGINHVFRSANAGNPDANAYVGQVYYEGLHEQPQDFVEARKYFELAAAEDHPAALMMLGVMYFQGKGATSPPN